LLSEKFPGKPVSDKSEYQREALLEELRKKHKRVTKLVHRFFETDHMRGIHFSRHGL
jgi:hypothetical protein